jgi:hypothetical protein
MLYSGAARGGLGLQQCRQPGFAKKAAKKQEKKNKSLMTNCTWNILRRDTLPLFLRPNEFKSLVAYGSLFLLVSGGMLPQLVCELLERALRNKSRPQLQYVRLYH